MTNNLADGLQKASGGSVKTYTPTTLTATTMVITIPANDIPTAAAYNMWALNPSPPAVNVSNALVLTVS